MQGAEEMKKNVNKAAKGLGREASTDSLKAVEPEGALVGVGRDGRGKQPFFQVADGRSVTSRRGILAAGSKITSSDLAAGEAALKVLVSSGHVVAVQP